MFILSGPFRHPVNKLSIGVYTCTKENSQFVFRYWLMPEHTNHRRRKLALHVLSVCVCVGGWVRACVRACVPERACVPCVAVG